MNDQKEFLYTETLNSHFCSTSFFFFLLDFRWHLSLKHACRHKQESPCLFGGKFSKEKHSHMSVNEIKIRGLLNF